MRNLAQNLNRITNRSASFLSVGININKMRKEFEMTQEEMDEIIAINKEGGDPVMYLSGGTPMGLTLQEKINDYWEKLGNKYGFDPLSGQASPKGMKSIFETRM